MSRSSEEDGVTVVELMVTLAVMGVIVAAVMTVLFSAYRETDVVLTRRDVLSDGQFGMQEMTKQFRQATSINTGSATAIDVSTFTGAGTSHDIEWRTTGSAAPYSLQTRTDGGTWKTVAAELESPNIFAYTDNDHDQVIDQVTITLALGTKTSTITLTSDVQMRNETQ